MDLANPQRSERELEQGKASLYCCPANGLKKSKRIENRYQMKYPLYPYLWRSLSRSFCPGSGHTASLKGPANQPGLTSCVCRPCLISLLCFES